MNEDNLEFAEDASELIKMSENNSLIIDTRKTMMDCVESIKRLFDALLDARLNVITCISVKVDCMNIRNMHYRVVEIIVDAIDKRNHVQLRAAKGVEKWRLNAKTFHGDRSRPR